ncbi:MAG TPA: ATP-binding cassette domain-containing protein [Candidatus Omnitrophota bacterium]|nr:ATP-binding cassette domain-containing protein [Candidatus Omnitrophota bacterium]HPS19582.1 ATP-binding cassette domain-containing protein [Candidatus Omnitrophota bacterium]
MIKLDNVKKYFRQNTMFGTAANIVKAVDGVSFSVDKGKTFGLVGESGCGKTTLSKLITGLIEPDSGSVKVSGDVDMVFQDPFSSLNPRMTIEEIIAEPLLVRGIKRSAALTKVAETLNMVKLGRRSVLKGYPHQFSGGERQRIAIARAIIRRPAVLILDEPVSSLDVSIQASILNLLKDIQEELALTYIFISHDLRVVEFMSDIIGVMKDGTLIEIASCDDIYSSPKHEYTRRLISAIPTI